MTNFGQVLEVGTLLIIETGSYSSRDWHGPVRVIKEFTKREVADRYQNECTTGGSYGSDTPDASGVLPWLVKEGYVEHVDNVHSWHVGDYEFEP